MTPISGFRVAMAQINPTVGDLDGNTCKIIELLEKAQALGADIVAFPELAVTGYPPEDLLIKTDFIREQRAYVNEIARHARDAVAVVGFAAAEDYLYNAAAVLTNGRLVGVYRKARLPNYGVFDERRYFQPGTESAVYVIRDVPVGVAICEDIWAPGGPLLDSSRAGALVVIVINGSPYFAGKWRMREEMIRTRARDYVLAVAYTNTVGGQDELVFDGMSLLVDPVGRIVARGPGFGEALIVADLDVEVRGIRRCNPIRTADTLKKEGGQVQVSHLVPPGPVEPRPPIQKTQTMELPGEIEEIYQALVLGTRDYVRKNGFRTVVLGLSGGIVPLVAYIAADALGPPSVKGVMMPSRFTSEASRRYAREVAAALDIELLELPIDPVVMTYEQVLASTFHDRSRDVTEENLQARTRGNLLMALSNKMGWLVLTTGNKSEMSVGYTTLYGDMAGGFAVIKDVPKTLVYRLARWRNARPGRPPIPRGVLERAPTPELRERQADEDTLPPFAVLDPILRLYVEEDRSGEDILAEGYDVATVDRVIAMVDRSEFKRRQAPPGIKITPKAFGKDRRLPITNGYHGHRGRQAPERDARGAGRGGAAEAGGSHSPTPTQSARALMRASPGADRAFPREPANRSPCTPTSPEPQSLG
jgi:NAD+ synthase (glutamine-hydrolysing)